MRGFLLWSLRPFAGILRAMNRTEVIRDLFGCDHAELTETALTISGTTWPVVDDVVILLDRCHWPATLAARIDAREVESAHGGDAACRENVSERPFAEDIQYTFGAEWQEFSEILPEHHDEFEACFDLVDVHGGESVDKRVCDLGCGMGRWSHFLRDHVRELILVDFSEAIFEARRNLADADHALFFMADLRALPFRNDFADFCFSLGVLHHLPDNCLKQSRAIGRYAPDMLIYLYYALDNRPAHFRLAFQAADVLRRSVHSIRNERFRDLFSTLVGAGVYLPLVWLGHGLELFGRGSSVPLWDGYTGKSLSRIRQDVYDRFFTSIEQRVSRAQVLELQDTYSSVVVSDGVPYWHFRCKR